MLYSMRTITRQICIKKAYASWNIIGCGMNEAEVGFFLTDHGVEVEF
jgi:hypothetical protein